GSPWPGRSMRTPCPSIRWSGIVQGRTGGKKGTPQRRCPAKWAGSFGKAGKNARRAGFRLRSSPGFWFVLASQSGKHFEAGEVRVLRGNWRENNNKKIKMREE